MARQTGMDSAASLEEPQATALNPEQARDAVLMARVATGDREAFGEIVDRHRDALVNVLTRLSGDPERAQDLAQEAFVRLFHAAPRYREQGTFRAYLYRIATNLLRSEERRARRVHFFSFESSREPLAPGGPDEDAERAELRSRLQRALTKLPLNFRVPLVLHVVEGWTVPEIARATNTREGTIKSRISRGRDGLRRALGQADEGGER